MFKKQSTAHPPGCKTMNMIFSSFHPYHIENHSHYLGYKKVRTQHKELLLAWFFSGTNAKQTFPRPNFCSLPVSQFRYRGIKRRATDALFLRVYLLTSAHFWGLSRPDWKRRIFLCPPPRKKSGRNFLRFRSLNELIFRLE